MGQKEREEVIHRELYLKLKIDNATKCGSVQDNEMHKISWDLKYKRLT